MKKTSPTYKRLIKQIDEIKKDLDAKADNAFLGRKYHTTRQTMKSFLLAAGLIEDGKDGSANNL